MFGIMALSSPMQTVSSIDDDRNNDFDDDTTMTIFSLYFSFTFIAFKLHHA